MDEFIDDAQHYANGGDNVINLVAKHCAPVVELYPQTAKVPFRKATFTLSEPCIASLCQLANQSGYAKSHLVRMLIRQFAESTPEAQQLLLAQQKHREKR